MSGTKKSAINNATDIIEAFGGIRPMASKLGVAVTTVQGWKKRDTIPANRKEAIIAAAAEQNIDLSPYIEDAPVVTAADAETPVAAKLPDTDTTPAQDSAEADTTAPRGSHGTDTTAEEDQGDASDDAIDTTPDDASPATPFVPEDDVEAKDVDDRDTADDVDDISPSNPIKVDEDPAQDNENIAAPAADVAQAIIAAHAVKHDATTDADAGTEHAAETEQDKETVSSPNAAAVKTARKGFAKTFLWLIVFVLICAAAAAYVLMPKSTAVAPDVSNTTAAVEDTESGFKGLVPQNLKDGLNDLKDHAQELKDSGQAAIKKTQTIAKDVAQDIQLENRVTQLKTYAAEMSEDEFLTNMIARYDALVAEDLKPYQRDRVMGEINAAYNTAKTSGADLVSQFQQVQNNVEASGLFQNISADNLTPAIEMFTLVKAQQDIAEQRVVDESSLQTIAGLVDDPSIAATAGALLPYAGATLKSLTGLEMDLAQVSDAVVKASLNTPDATIEDQIKATLNDVMSVEKNGIMVSGTPTQIVMDTAMKKVRAGEFDTALNILENNLSTPELTPLMPFIRDLRAVATAHDFEAAVTHYIETKTGRNHLSGGRLSGSNPAAQPVR